MLRFVKLLTVVSVIICVATISHGQTSRSTTTTTTTTKTTTQRKATVSFGDELVEGGTQKPELFYLFQKKNFNYTRLIKLRENFLPEMRRTAEDIQRVRGGN